MVEAFMVGLNHEMARELLWREYPTDQRGAYFRQFWDIAGFVPGPGESPDLERLKDITPIHSWRKSSWLGEHRPTIASGGGDYLVLFVRGDLLRRYPHTVIYAARARWAARGLREIDDPVPEDGPEQIVQKQRWPRFSGFLEPDATFFGFDLTASEAMGDTNPSGDPGWFFLLQEPPEEPRFGLDEGEGAFGAQVSEWNNLSWRHLVRPDESLEALSAIDLNSDLPNTTSVGDPVTTKWHADRGSGSTGSRASDLAYITFQVPMRVAIHGSDMIP
jgi:hypothetical protein